MSTIRYENLRTQARALLPDLEKAQDITEKAKRDGRPLSAAEQAVVDPIIERSKTIGDALRRERNDAAVMAAARGLADEIGGPIGTSATGAKSGQRLSFKGMAETAATKMLGEGRIGGIKSLAPSGVELLPQSFVSDPIALGKPAQGLLDIVPVRQQTSPSFAYLKQVSRDNQASVVAEGDLKPVTELGLERVESQLQVVAHLSSPAPKFWFEDVAALRQFVEAEFQYGLNAAVEQLILDTVNDTSGVQSQAFSTSIIETLRHGITKLEVAGHRAVAAVLHPADWALCELTLASTSAISTLGLPFDAARRTLFGVAIAVTTAQAPGTAHLLGADALVLDTDTAGVQLQWSENAGAETFRRNETVLRAELRVAVSPQAPLGIVIATVAD